MKDLGLQIRKLPFDLVVSTLVIGQMSTLIVCFQCLVIIKVRQIKINLIYVPVSRLSAMLGMDWLFSNKIFIDHNLKMLAFSKSWEMVLLSSQQVWSELNEGTRCYVKAKSDN